MKLEGFLVLHEILKTEDDGEVGDEHGAYGGRGGDECFAFDIMCPCEWDFGEGNDSEDKACERRHW